MIKKGVDVYNIDEFCTSKTCWRCGDSMRKSIWYIDQMTLNRDVNDALNIHHLAYSIDRHGCAEINSLK
jgi:transposase